MSDGKMKFCKQHGKFDTCASEGVSKAEGWPDNGIIHHRGTKRSGLKGAEGRPATDTGVWDDGNREFDGTPQRGTAMKGKDAGTINVKNPHGKHKGLKVKDGNTTFSTKVGDMHVKKSDERTGHDAFLDGEITKAYSHTAGYTMGPALLAGADAKKGKKKKAMMGAVKHQMKAEGKGAVVGGAAGAALGGAIGRSGSAAALGGVGGAYVGALGNALRPKNVRGAYDAGMKASRSK